VVVVEGNIFAFSLDTAGELGASDLYLGVHVSGDARIGNCNSPEHGGAEIWGLRVGIDIARFVADFGGNAGVGLGEREKGNEQR